MVGRLRIGVFVEDDGEHQCCNGHRNEYQQRDHKDVMDDVEPSAKDGEAEEHGDRHEHHEPEDRAEQVQNPEQRAGSGVAYISKHWVKVS